MKRNCKNRKIKMRTVLTSPLVAGKTVHEVEGEYCIQIESVDGAQPGPDTSLELGAAVAVNGRMASVQRFRQDATAPADYDSLLEPIKHELMKEFGIDETRAASFAENFVRKIKESKTVGDTFDELIHRL